MNIDVNDLWLGRMQQELGVLSSNLMLVTLQRNALQAKLVQEAELIEALKARCQSAETANETLRALLQPDVKVRQKAAPRSSGKDDVANQAQSA